MFPLVAMGKSVGEAPPLESKTKFFAIATAISEPPLEVVDHVAGIQFGFPGGDTQPIVFAGCGPLSRTSTLFWAASGAAPSSNVPPSKTNIRRFFMAFFSPAECAASTRNELLDNHL